MKITIEFNSVEEYLKLKDKLPSTLTKLNDGNNENFIKIFIKIDSKCFEEYETLFIMMSNLLEYLANKDN